MNGFVTIIANENQKQNPKPESFGIGTCLVAFSRVRTGKNLYVFVPDEKLKNIVYQTALQ